MRQPTQLNSTETLEHILRLEITAVDTYEKAIRDVGDAEFATELVDLRREHEAAAGDVRNLLASMHDPDDEEIGSSMLAKMARALETIAHLFGSRPTLRALEAGERALRTELEVMLEDVRLPPEADRLIRQRLLPATEARATRLQQMREAV